MQQKAIIWPLFVYHAHMKRVQVQLTEPQLDAMRQRAEATGEGLASVIREAVDDWIARQERTQMWERAFAAVGAFHSGLGDLAERHDDYLDGDAEW